MKYTSILAGAFGLMALAACTNSDEVKMEQPKVANAPTLTVTWGKGADTRLIMDEWDFTEGIPSRWESGDQIGLSENGDADVIIYETNDTGATATFSLVGDAGPENGTEYIIAYPAAYFTKGFVVENQSGAFGDLKNYAYSIAHTTFTDNVSDNKVTLEPMFSFLCIPQGTVFEGAANAGSWTASEVEATYLELSGENLLIRLTPASGTIKKNPTTRAAVVVDGPTLEKGDITIDCAGVFDFNDEGEIFNTSDIFIAVPVEKGGEIEPTNLILTLQTSDPEGPHAYFNIGKVTDGSFTYSTVNESGKLYNLKDYLVYSGGGRM